MNIMCHFFHMINLINLLIHIIMHWKKYVTQTHIEFKRESKETIIFNYEQVEAGQLAGIYLVYFYTKVLL